MVDKEGWIGVDLDGTLAMYDGWKGVEHIGEPIPLMMERVKSWLKEGQEVRIMTARVSVTSPRQLMEVCKHIHAWLDKHFGEGHGMATTCRKDFEMIELWDDRCHRVEKNTGVEL